MREVKDDSAQNNYFHQWQKTEVGPQLNEDTYMGRPVAIKKMKNIVCVKWTCQKYFTWSNFQKIGKSKMWVGNWMKTHIWEDGSGAKTEEKDGWT